MKKKALPAILKGKRVILRKHVPQVAQALFVGIDTERKRLRRFFSWVDQVRGYADILRFVKICQKEWAARQGFTYSIFDAKTNKLAGSIDVHDIRWQHESCEFGYMLFKPFEGRGFMTESVRLLEEFCTKAGFQRFEIHCDARNKRSADVAQRCGYKHEGTLRQNFRVGEKRVSTMIFGKLRR